MTPSLAVEAVPSSPKRSTVTVISGSPDPTLESTVFEFISVATVCSARTEQQATLIKRAPAMVPRMLETFIRSPLTQALIARGSYVQDFQLDALGKQTAHYRIAVGCILTVGITDSGQIEE
jgi:hypothetical protein